MFDLPSLTNIDGLVSSEPRRPLLIPHPEGSPQEFILQVDNSTMEKYQTCPRAAKYYCIDRRERPGKAALIFGGAIHAGLEAYYSLDRNHPNIPQFMVAAAQDYFAKHSYSPGDDYRTPAFAADVLVQYYHNYSYSEDFIPIEIDGKPAVEVPFALNIGSFDLNTLLPYHRAQLLGDDCENPEALLYISTLHIQWTGKIDMIARDPQGRLIIVDHKTSSIAGANFFQDFELSQQTRGYTWAAKQLLNLPLIDFFTVNALFCRKPTKTGKGVEFGRAMFHYDIDSLDEWHEDTMAAIESFVHSLIHHSFPKYTKWCMGKYGQCPYFNVCKLHPSKRESALASDEYINVTWSPLT